VAAVRREVAESLIGKALRMGTVGALTGFEPGKNCRFIDDPEDAFQPSSRVVEPLTIAVTEAYIRPLGAPPLLRRDGASAKPLTVYAVNEHPAMILWPCRMRGVSAAPAFAGDGAARFRVV